jgi:hypothetical protein
MNDRKALTAMPAVEVFGPLLDPSGTNVAFLRLCERASIRDLASMCADQHRAQQNKSNLNASQP